uniref:Uncharacterized protein n=1 Tax=Ananas comosus var. bracteatus TaxID=296719 RepID=A0A6V7PXN9_ANACO|nr:unnamed protein product [Ananas comosus var. bracteatus]
MAPREASKRAKRRREKKRRRERVDKEKKKKREFRGRSRKRRGKGTKERRDDTYTVSKNGLLHPPHSSTRRLGRGHWRPPAQHSRRHGRGIGSMQLYNLIEDSTTAKISRVQN